ncbi:MAG: hypothetical protein ACLQGP_27020 [Isosphaeraceae bacterium]
MSADTARPRPTLEQLRELVKALERFLYHDEQSSFSVPRAQESHRLPGFLRVADAVRPLRDLEETDGWPAWLKDFIPQLIMTFDILAYSWGWGELLKPEEARAAYIARCEESFRNSFVLPIQKAARLCRKNFSSIECPHFLEELCETVPAIDFDLSPRINHQDRLDPLWDAVYRKRAALMLGESFPTTNGGGDDPDKFASDIVLGGTLRIALRKLAQLVAKSEPKPDQQTQPLANPGPIPTRQVGDLPPYRLEDQTWHGALPDLADTSADELHSLAAQIDIVLFTATDIELHAALRRLDPLAGRREVLKGFAEQETYYLGTFGSCKVAVTKCRMGSVGSGSAELATQHAIRVWGPRAIIMAGIAFGRDPTRQQLGDILIASEIIPYEPQRVGQAETIHRGVSVPVSQTLLNRFDNVPHWSFLRPGGSQCGRQIGPLLSGEKLIDDPAFKRSLFGAYPAAIGGEMEGAGLAAAAHRQGIPWIVAKAICDWGDGTKHGGHQPLAAAAAVSLVHHILSQVDVLHGLEKKTR